MGAAGGSKNGSKQHVDITEYLCLPQSDAAVKLGLPVSTLSKRWKEAAKNRKVGQLRAALCVSPLLPVALSQGFQARQGDCRRAAGGRMRYLCVSFSSSLCARAFPRAAWRRECCRRRWSSSSRPCCESAPMTCAKSRFVCEAMCKKIKKWGVLLFLAGAVVVVASAVRGAVRPLFACLNGGRLDLLLLSAPRGHQQVALDGQIHRRIVAGQQIALIH
jgi:hypothetical protein